jgi:hypothetical protein
MLSWDAKPIFGLTNDLLTQLPVMIILYERERRSIGCVIFGILREPYLGSRR